MCMNGWMCKKNWKELLYFFSFFFYKIWNNKIYIGVKISKTEKKHKYSLKIWKDWKLWQPKFVSDFIAKKEQAKRHSLIVITLGNWGPKYFILKTLRGRSRQFLQTLPRQKFQFHIWNINCLINYCSWQGNEFCKKKPLCHLDKYISIWKD